MHLYISRQIEGELPQMKYLLLHPPNNPEKRHSKIYWKRCCNDFFLIWNHDHSDSINTNRIVSLVERSVVPSSFTMVRGMGMCLRA